MFTFLAPVYDILLAGVQKRQINFLLAELKQSSLRNSNVLDLGGGTGKLSHVLRHYNADAFLLDPSLAMLKKAAKRLPEDKTFLGSAENIPFPDNFFEMVVIIDALHHFNNTRKALQESCRVLKKNGRLFVLDFNKNSSFVAFLEKFERCLGEKPTFFTPQELTELLIINNLKVLKAIEPSPREYLIIAQK